MVRVFGFGVDQRAIRVLGLGSLPLDDTGVAVSADRTGPADISGPGSDDLLAPSDASVAPLDAEGGALRCVLGQFVVGYPCHLRSHPLGVSRREVGEEAVE